MNESQCAYWFQVANKWAMEMSMFEDEARQPDYDTPVVISKPNRTAHQDEDTTISFRLYEESAAKEVSNSSQQKKKSKTVKDSTERNYSLISNSHPVGQVLPPSTAVTSVIIERSLQHDNNVPRSGSTHTAAETLEFILGCNGEPVPEPVYQTPFQCISLPLCHQHLLTFSVRYHLCLLDSKALPPASFVKLNRRLQLKPQ